MSALWRRLTGTPLSRLIVFEIIIFGVVGLVCSIIRFDYSMGLAIVGAALLAMRFRTTPNLYTGGIGNERLERGFIRDANNPTLMQRGYDFIGDLLVVGLIPLIVGIVLAFA
jgi:hypothetical protein